MGYYVVPDTSKIGVSSPIKESNSKYEAPSGTVIIGRKHDGDENGNTEYQYAPLRVDPNDAANAGATIALSNATWTDSQKQLDFDYQAPSGWVIIGRKHDGDENGQTSYKIAQVIVQGSSIVKSVNGITSGSIKESSNIWYTAPSLVTMMEVMTGNKHKGDENGDTWYYSKLLYKE